LITDGTLNVNETIEIVELVGKNCKSTNKVRLHTFGIGLGADQLLVKSCAHAGKGHYTFILDDE